MNHVRNLRIAREAEKQTAKLAAQNDAELAERNAAHARLRRDIYPQERGMIGGEFVGDYS
jgi:hypothetical protein